jgi:hypothetical protein
VTEFMFVKVVKGCGRKLLTQTCSELGEINSVNDSPYICVLLFVSEIN